MPCPIIGVLAALRLHEQNLKVSCVIQVAESSSALFGAFAFDTLCMGVRSVSLLMASISGVTCCLWIVYAWCQWPRHSRPGSQHHSEKGATESDVEYQSLLGSQQ